MRFGQLQDTLKMADSNSVLEAESILQSVIQDGLLSEREIRAVRTLVNASKLNSYDALADVIIPCEECRFARFAKDRENSFEYILCCLDKDSKIKRRYDDFCSFGRIRFRYRDYCNEYYPISYEEIEIPEIDEECESMISQSLITSDEIDAILTKGIEKQSYESV